MYICISIHIYTHPQIQRCYRDYVHEIKRQNPMGDINRDLHKLVKI